MTCDSTLLNLHTFPWCARWKRNGDWSVFSFVLSTSIACSTSKIVQDDSRENNMLSFSINTCFDWNYSKVHWAIIRMHLITPRDAFLIYSYVCCESFTGDEKSPIRTSYDGTTRKNYNHNIRENLTRLTWKWWRISVDSRNLFAFSVISITVSYRIEWGFYAIFA